MKKLYKKILNKITPSAKEILAEKKLVEEIRKKIAKIEGKHSHLEWCGSSARGTHLRGDRDLDLFVMFDKTLPPEELEKEGLRVGKSIFRGHTWEMAYSQHPYIRGKIKGFEVEIVPSYIVASGAEKQSAVDRTPFHNKYLLEKLSENGKQEARLLKQFLKGINAYGADLKNCSLPGYGVELLIVKYGSFEDVLRAISKWEKGIVITLGNQNEETAKALFSEAHYPLILIDPVDANRNVASALTTRQFERIILAAEMFLQKPSEKFFFPTKVKTWKRKKVSEMLKMKELIAIQATFPKNILPDIMWGQLKRFEKKCAAFLHEKDFKVLRDDVWSDEKKVVFIFELELLNLQKSKKIIGPPAHDIMNIRRFLEGKKILSGPRVEDAHIVIEIERNETSAHKMLEEFIKLEKVGEKKDIRTMLKGAQVLSEKRILLTYKGVFAEYFTIYLEGKESFE